MSASVWIFIAAAAVLGSPAFAAETTVYTYDAQGRLVAVVNSGDMNNGVQTSYQYDLAGNRTQVNTSGR